MLMLAAISTIAAAEANTQTPQQQEHALVLAETQGQRKFIHEAARFADTDRLAPVTLDEINALVAAERSNDLKGCTDVACYSEIAGAFDIKYVVSITPHDTENKATLSLYSLFPAPRRLRDEVVSHETEREALLRSFAEFRQRRNVLASLLKEIPCGFPWLELRAAIGKPHFDTLYQPRWGRMFEYFDLVIFMTDDKVTDIKGQFGSGPTLLACNRMPSRQDARGATRDDDFARTIKEFGENFTKRWNALRRTK